MQIKITTVSVSLGQAAEIEKALEKIGVEFTITTTGTGVRHIIKPDVVSEVLRLEEKGTPRAVIAQELDIGPTTVARICNGEHKKPR